MRGLPESQSLAQWDAHLDGDPGGPELRPRARSVRSRTQPADPAHWPITQPSDRDDIDCRDGTDLPRVDTFRRVVALDPPAVLGGKPKPLDREWPSAGQSYDGD